MLKVFSMFSGHIASAFILPALTDDCYHMCAHQLMGRLQPQHSEQVEALQQGQEV